MAEHKPLVILTAVITEARAAAATLELPVPAIDRPARGTYQAQPIELHLIGIAGRHLPIGLHGAKAILLAGLAGGLDPELQVGDVIIDRGNPSDRAGSTTEIPNPTMPMPGSTGPPPLVRPGRIVCCPKLAATPAEKAELFRQTAAAAVDMESDIVRRAAGSVPMVHLRAISDAADDFLDPALLQWVDTIGRPRPKMLAIGLLKRPAAAAALMRLAKHVRTATRALSAALPIAIDEIG